MFLPLGDEPNPRGVPYVNYALIAVNCAVYLFVTLPLSTTAASMNDPALIEYLRAVGSHLPPGVSIQQVLHSLSAYDLFIFTHGYRPADPSIASLFSAMFLHSGFMHLAGNMLFLWIYGDNVEHRLGSIAYLFWYLATGVVATLFFAWFDPQSTLPMVGASGAISGVLGFYFVWFPHNRVRLWVFLFPFIMDVFLVPARLVLGIFLILENLLPFLVQSGGTGVAYGAHIGGFLAGLAAAWVIDRTGAHRHGTSFAPAARPTKADTSRDPISSAIDEGRFADAAAAYFALSPEESRRALHPRDSLALGEWLVRHGHPRAALVVDQRHLRDYPLGPGIAEAHAGAGLVQLHAFSQPTAAYQHFVEALEHDPLPQTEETVRAAMAQIAARQKFQVGRRGN